MILKLITVKETYELKTDDVKATELLNQIAIRRPEQMITIGKNEGAPYTIGIKPAHLVGYELIPESVQDKASVLEIVPGQVVAPNELSGLKTQIETLSELVQAIAETVVYKDTQAAPAKKAGRPKATKE